LTERGFGTSAGKLHNVNGLMISPFVNHRERELVRSFQYQDSWPRAAKTPMPATSAGIARE
jgi:hypothetical protein